MRTGCGPACLRAQSGATIREGGPLAAPPQTEILTFLIADVRGYTSYTQTHGDEAAARLAMTFAEIATEATGARGGCVNGLRGDEALAVFPSARQALRAAVELQQTLLDEIELDPSMPLRVGIGIDAGETVQVEGGYRGGALNLAPRLCSHAGPGEILVSQGVAHLARTTGDLRFLDRGTAEFKGLAEPVQVLQIAAPGLDPDEVSRRIGVAAEPNGDMAARPSRPELPPELDLGGALIGRDVEARWIRWAWRRTRSGDGRTLAITGPLGIGKTRLTAEIASLAGSNGARVSYLACADGSTGLGAAVEAFRGQGGPALLIVDDLDASSDGHVAELGPLIEDLPPRVMVVLTARDDAPSEVTSLRRRASSDGAHRRLDPMDAADVQQLSVLYAPDALTPAPVEAILDATGGLPGDVQRMVARWAEGEASRRLGQATTRA